MIFDAVCLWDKVVPIFVYGVDGRRRRAIQATLLDDFSCTILSRRIVRIISEVETALSKTLEHQRLV